MTATATAVAVVTGRPRSRARRGVTRATAVALTEHK